MSISVHYAVRLPQDNPHALYALPEGFPILVIDEQQRIIEPVLLYQLAKRTLRGKRHWVENTTLAEAFDLRDWFDFLAEHQWINPVSQKNEIGKPWDLASQSDYIFWRDCMHELISPRTNQRLSSGTISRRQGAVERFYKHAQTHGWYNGSFFAEKKTRDRPNNASLGRNKSPSQKHNDEGYSQFKEAIGPAAPIRPLSASEWNLLKTELGPLPSEAEFEHIASRDRLASELSLGTGMRVDEIASLTVLQVHALDKHWRSVDGDQRESGFFKLRITKTKRLKPRDVLVPGYLIPELMLYIDGERKTAVEAQRVYALKKGKRFKDPLTLFVNRLDAGSLTGKSVNATSLSWAFKQACLRADITHHVEKFDLESEERYYEIRAKHRFHDLRHTFAVWKYHSNVENGEHEPWKEIQTLLGHSNLETTLNTYLAVVDVDRRNAGYAQYAAKTSMGRKHA